MSLIHPTAIIADDAKIHESATIGPYSIIGPQVVIGANTKLASHVVIEGYTSIGEDCNIAANAVIGGLPQDLNFGGETSYVSIGNGVTIREFVTINRATGEGKHTVVGDNAFIMAYTHLAHNCQIGAGAILANNAQLAGYVEVGEKAFISGSTVVHQFVKIGRLAILAGFSGTRQDIPPFAMTNGIPARVSGLNKVALKRAGFSLNERNVLKKVYQLLWFSDLRYEEAFACIREEFGTDPLAEEVITFVLESKRGIHHPVKSKSAENSHLNSEAEVAPAVS